MIRAKKEQGPDIKKHKVGGPVLGSPGSIPFQS
jgi:hypothetical protein